MSKWNESWRIQKAFQEAQEDIDYAEGWSAWKYAVGFLTFAGLAATVLYAVFGG